MKKSLLLISLLMLSGCMTPEQREAARQAQLQQDANTCAEYGFRVKSDAFRNCMLQLELSRQQQRNYYNNYDSYPRFSYGFYHFHH